GRPPSPRPTVGAPVDVEELPGIVIPEIPRKVTPAPPPSAAAKPADDGLAWLDHVSTPLGGSKPDEALFEDEEGFFDLAAELEQELTKEDLLAGKALVPAQEQSLEEIVEGFKKGVAESLSPEDFDTHFNLGIAYREMGLLDEAIGEFQLAAKDAKYLLDCCSLLGACFLAKGLPELAVKWYQKGLETPELTEDATLGLLYDLGNLYQSVGETDKARKTFVEIYGVNSNYRDVVARLEELGD
ncbi:MAG: tetratricopeptide repeat protein, partial [Thermoanaerobaculia bacterium]|nr:tetratricopeptide repeat protein [Thermoanaerobaculia bacterium]